MLLHNGGISFNGLPRSKEIDLNIRLRHPEFGGALLARGVIQWK